MIVDPISEDDVFERLKAELSREGLVLHRGSLDGKVDDGLGRFYATDAATGSVLQRHLDLERWARQHGVLKPNEALVPSHGEGA